MKFKQYINEITIKPTDNVMQVLELVKKHCKLYLKDYKKTDFRYHLLTGRAGASGPFAIRKIRTDRNPKDTPRNIHNFFNDVFYRMFRIPLRSESMFCTANAWVADDYGKVYLVLPVGKYDIYWSPDVGDLYSDIVDDGLIWSEGGNDVGFPSDDAEEEFEKFMSSYRKGNLQRALNSKNEIMLVAKQVILVEKDAMDQDGNGFENELIKMVKSL